MHTRLKVKQSLVKANLRGRGRHGADDGRERVAAERVLEDARDLGGAVGDVLGTAALDRRGLLGIGSCR